MEQQIFSAALDLTSTQHAPLRYRTDQTFSTGYHQVAEHLRRKRKKKFSKCDKI
jgi:hypothetical protein